MINKLPLVKGLNMSHMRIPSIIPIKGKGFINHGPTTLVYSKYRGSSTIHPETDASLPCLASPPNDPDIHLSHNLNS